MKIRSFLFARAGAALLAAALLLTLCACGTAESPVLPSPAADPPSGAAAQPAPSPADSPEQAPPATDPAANGPAAYGMRPRPQPGQFYSGRTVAFEDSAYTAFADGIYRLTGENALLQASANMIFDHSICTDGYLLYFVDLGGTLRELDLASGKVIPITEPQVLPLPYQAQVVGVTQGHVWVEVPAEDEDYEMDGWTTVLAVSRRSGMADQSFEGVEAGCSGGLVWLLDQSFDYCPRQLQVFSAEDELILTRDGVWNTSGQNGALWYDGYDETADRSILYRLDGEGETVALSLPMGMDEAFYGVWVNGFLVEQMTISGEGGLLTHYWDLRTGQPFSDEQLQLYPSGPYWLGGYTVNGQDFLVNYSRLARMTDGQPVDVLELPCDLQADGIILLDGMALVDGWQGEYYALPFDPQADTILTPMTAVPQSYELYDGKNGATVTGHCTVLGYGNNLFWPGLDEALTAYNADAQQRLRANMEELVNDASALVENGFADALEPFASYVTTYIRRSDTQAFCFVEHQTEDNRVNRASRDVKTGYNFDTRDGHALSLDEVITDLSALREALVLRLEEGRMPTRAQIDDFLQELLSAESLVSRPELSWVLGYEGITFYFNGQINYPFDLSSVNCYIPFSAAPELFRDRWRSIPGDYAYDILVSDYFGESYGLESDEGYQTVNLSVTRSPESGLLDSIRIYQPSEVLAAGGSTRAHSIVSDTVWASVLHQDGKNYLLAQYDGDSMYLEVYSLDRDFDRLLTMQDAALPQRVPPTDWESDLPYISHTWLGDPDFLSILGKTWIGEEVGYCHRVYYQLRRGGLKRLDLSGASFGVG